MRQIASYVPSFVFFCRLYWPTGRSENKNMMQFSPFENEVRPGVVVFIIRFFIFAAIASVILGYGNQIRPFCRMRTKIMTSVNGLFCRMFTTLGLASSSNGVNNAKPLFSERPISCQVNLPTLNVLVL